MLGTSEKVDVEVTWAGGHRTAAQITRPVACLTQLSYYPQLAARARELADSGCTLTQIAGRLNLRVQQLDVNVESKTEDNVFVRVVV